MTASIRERWAMAPRRRIGLAALGASLLAAIAGAVALPRPTLPPTGEPHPHWLPPKALLRLADDAAERFEPEPLAATGTAETQLIEIYRGIAAGRLAQAAVQAQRLVQAEPNFRLAQLVYADLLAARAGPLSDFGASAPGDFQALATLKQEALLRLQALAERPPAGAVPAEFVRLPASVPYAIAVDTSRARLYLFENGDAGPRLIADYYVSIGRLGTDKIATGDQKTPLGVYFVTGHAEPHRLDERLGAGALPLNYPNAYDKVRGRTGGGILLHGVPQSTYARPPLDSDGCVVLANDDLQAVAARLPPRDTPVVITQHVQWTAAAAPESPADGHDFFAALQGWQAARERGETGALAGFYEAASQPASAPVRPARIAPDWSVLTWGEAPQMRVVTYQEFDGERDKRGRLMRQYWAQSSGRWAIVAEGVVR